MNDFLYTIALAGIVVSIIRLIFALGRVARQQAPVAPEQWWCPICEGEHNPALCPENASTAIFEVPERDVQSEQFIADTETYLAERAEYYSTYGREQDDE